MLRDRKIKRNNNFKDDLELSQTHHNNRDFNSIISLNPSLPNQSQLYLSDPIINPLDSDSNWRVFAIMGLIWTIVLLLVVFLFVIRKTVFADFNLRYRHRLFRETDVENEWTTASFDDNGHEDVPLSSNISHDNNR